MGTYYSAEEPTQESVNILDLISALFQDGEKPIIVLMEHKLLPFSNFKVKVLLKWKTKENEILHYKFITTKHVPQELHCHDIEADEYDTLINAEDELKNAKVLLADFIKRYDEGKLSASFLEGHLLAEEINQARRFLGQEIKEIPMPESVKRVMKRPGQKA